MNLLSLLFPPTTYVGVFHHFFIQSNGFSVKHYSCEESEAVRKAYNYCERKDKSFNSCDYEIVEIKKQYDYAIVWFYWFTYTKNTKIEYFKGSKSDATQLAKKVKSETHNNFNKCNYIVIKM